VPRPIYLACPTLFLTGSPRVPFVSSDYKHLYPLGTQYFLPTVPRGGGSGPTESKSTQRHNLCLETKLHEIYFYKPKCAQRKNLVPLTLYTYAPGITGAARSIHCSWTNSTALSKAGPMVSTISHMFSMLDSSAFHGSGS